MGDSCKHVQTCRTHKIETENAMVTAVVNYDIVVVMSACKTRFNCLSQGSSLEEALLRKLLAAPHGTERAAAVSMCRYATLAGQTSLGWTDKPEIGHINTIYLLLSSSRACIQKGVCQGALSACCRPRLIV
jgi:hypothetical protein